MHPLPILLAAAVFATPLPPQQVSITPTACTDNQMVGFWHVQGAELEITVQAITQDWVGTFGFLALSAGDQGCAVPLPLGPSCFPSLTPNDIAGPLIFDPSSLLSVALCAHPWFTFWEHRMLLPIATLPAAAAAWQWTAQIVIYDAPTGCWLATGNALRFTAHS